MKFIFLDVDGVLNSATTTHRITVKFNDVERRYVGLCPDLVQRFNKIIDAHPDAKIVISSSWRKLGLENVTKLLRDAGLRGDIVDVTPRRMGAVSNGAAIRWWLEKHPEADTIVILDDKADGMTGWITKFNPRWDILETWEPDIGRDLRPHHVKTNEDDGLQDEHVELAIKILNGHAIPVPPVTEDD